MRPLTASMIAIFAVLTSSAIAAEVRVVCEAVREDDEASGSRRSREDDDAEEYERLRERDRRPVVLMARAKVRRLKQPNFKPEESRWKFEFPTQAVEITIEKVLFGSPDVSTIRLQLDGEVFIPFDSEKASYVYSFVSGPQKGNEPPVYSLNGGFCRERILEPNEAPEALALAQARLDYLVLGSHAIVVGRPEGKGVVVERVLHGSLEKGETLTCHLPRAAQIPLTASKTYLYLLAAPAKGTDPKACEVRAQWSTEAIPAVKESLARRERYPFDTNDAGAPARQEIILLGSHTEALRMLSSGNAASRRLAEQRIARDGGPKLEDLIAEVESRLFEKATRASDFHSQEDLIERLGKIGGQQADGAMIRLIDRMLSAAEKGTEFPGVPPPRDPAAPVSVDDDEERLFQYQRYDSKVNHSLGWLLLNLPPSQVASRFGERLLKLRDLTPYGWKEEVQFVIDHQHLVERLTLPKVEAKCRDIRPSRFPIQGEAIDLRQSPFALSPDGKWLAAAGETLRVWKTDDWTLAGERRANQKASLIAFAADSQSLFAAGGSDQAYLVRWNWQTNQVVERYLGLPGRIDELKISGDGLRLFVAGRTGEKGLLHIYMVGQPQPAAKIASEAASRVFPHPAGDSFLVSSQADKNETPAWYLGRLDGSREKLPDGIAQIAWCGSDRFWTLEERKETRRERKLLADPFGGSAEAIEREEIVVVKQATFLRQRQATAPFAIVKEVNLFPAYDELLVSADGSTLVLLNSEYVETRTAPDWKVRGVWELQSIDPFRDRRFTEEYRRRKVRLAANGNSLWFGELREETCVVDTLTGRHLPLGKGHQHQVVSLAFSDDGQRLICSDSVGIRREWEIASGQAIPAPAPRAPFEVVALDDRGPKPPVVDEKGNYWSFVEHRRGKYEYLESLELRIRKTKPPLLESSYPHEDEIATLGTKLGELRVRFQQDQVWGLVPGGEYVHLGAQIYSRRDLRSISSANVLGEIEKIGFSPDGKRYAIATASFEPSRFIDKEGQRRIRIHSSESGETLFSQHIEGSVDAIAISRDKSRLAACCNGQIWIWQLPAE